MSLTTRAHVVIDPEDLPGITRSVAADVLPGSRSAWVQIAGVEITAMPRGGKHQGRKLVELLRDLADQLDAACDRSDGLDTAARAAAAEPVIARALGEPTEAGAA